MSTKPQLSYESLGSGKPIMFLHGLLGMKSNWRGIANAFSAKHTCILVDARNHGKSFHHPSHTYNDLAKDTLALIEELDLNELILVGHSMGGKTLYQLTQYDSSRIKAFCIVDILPVEMPNTHHHILSALSHIPLETCSTRSQIADYFKQQFDDITFAQFLAKNSVSNHSKTEFFRKFSPKITKKCLKNSKFAKTQFQKSKITKTQFSRNS